VVKYGLEGVTRGVGGCRVAAAAAQRCAVVLGTSVTAELQRTAQLATFVRAARITQRAAGACWVTAHSCNARCRTEKETVAEKLLTCQGHVGEVSGDVHKSGNACRSCCLDGHLVRLSVDLWHVSSRTHAYRHSMPAAQVADGREQPLHPGGVRCTTWAKGLVVGAPSDSTQACPQEMSQNSVHSMAARK
jgi:hypothetical protein